MSRMTLIDVVDIPFGHAKLAIGRYPKGGAICVELDLIAEEECSWILSTNLVPYGAQLANDEFTVKSWSENEPLIAPLLATGFFEDTGRRIASGFAEAPVWRVKDPAYVPPVPESVAPA